MSGREKSDYRNPIDFYYVFYFGGKKKSVSIRSKSHRSCLL